MIREVADLASSFAALMSRLNSELAGRDLVLREDMVRKETQRLSGEVAQLFDESPLDFYPGSIGQSDVLEQSNSRSVGYPRADQWRDTLNWRLSALMQRLSTGAWRAFWMREKRNYPSHCAGG